MSKEGKQPQAKQRDIACENAAAASASAQIASECGFELSRRQMVRRGIKLLWVPPIVMTLASSEVMAGASNPSGNLSCMGMGESCIIDTDCCSGVCSIGTCS